MTVPDGALILAWIVIALLSLALAGVMRQLRVVTQAVERAWLGDGLGQRVGGRLAVEGLDFPTEVPTLLVMADSNCEQCQRLLPHLERLGRSRVGELRLVVAFREDSVPATRGLHVLTNQRALFGRLGVQMTPFGVLLDSEGRIAAGMPLGSPRRLRDLLGERLAVALDGKG